jgi:hypothetical protein
VELATATPPRQRAGLDGPDAPWWAWRAGQVLVALHLGAVTWLVWDGGLFVDDIRAQAYAAGRTWWPFVVESNRTHLAPGARAVDWLMATYAPLQHWPAVVLTVGIALLLGVAALRLVHGVVVHPWARGLGVAWVLFAASVVPTFAWFRQALTVLLPLALVLLAVSLVLDHLRTARLQPLAAAVALHAVALGFSERALAVPVVVLALVVVVRPSPLWRRGLVALTPFVLLNVAFLLAYARGDFDRAERSDPGLVDAVAKIGRWAVVDLLPSLAGGPVRWRPGIGAYSFADTPAVLVVASAALLVLGLFSAVRTPGSLRAALPVALVAGAYAVPVLTMVYVWRLARVEDPTAADDLRLLPDVTAVVAIALAALVGAVLERRDVQRARLRRPAALLATAVTLLCTVSWTTFGVRWHGTTVEPFLATVREEVSATSGQVLPSTVPAEVVPGWVDPAFTSGPLVALLNPDALSAELSGAPEVIGPDGTLVPASLGRVGEASVPEGFCGLVLPVGQRTATVDLMEDAPYYRGSAVVLGILVGDAERLNMRVTDRDGIESAPLVANPPELLRGPHRLIATLPHGAAVRSITVEVETANTNGVCITSAQVVTVAPAP